MSAREDFELVVAHYACPPDEVALMKEVASRDREHAIQWFALLANEIREEFARAQLADGIANETASGYSS